MSKKLTVVRLKNGRVPGPVLRENLAGRKLPGGSLDDGRVGGLKSARKGGK